MSDESGETDRVTSTDGTTHTQAAQNAVKLYENSGEVYYLWKAMDAIEREQRSVHPDSERGGSGAE